MKSIFDWLPLSDRKGLPTPRVMFRDLSTAQGLYYQRTVEKTLDDDLGIDRSEGDVIVFSTHWGEVSGSIVAHEHRHFQQRYGLCPIRLGSGSAAKHDDTWESWRIAVRRFYRTQAWEMDALTYSMRVHRDQSAEEHFEVVL